jgi:hypothetical protein
MTASLVHALIASAALAAGSPPPAQESAQQASPNDPSAIVVTGERNRKEQIADFVRALTPVRSGRQISRFEQAVCPAVSGLPQAQEAAVAARIRIVAKRVGIDVGGARCDPNFVVIVTPDKTALLEQLRKHRPEYFGDLTRHEISQVLRQPGPAAAWQLAGPPLDSRGTTIRYDPDFGVPIVRTTDPGSWITAAAHPQFASAVVVVDQDALAGLTTTQLADYAAMRALAKTDPTKIHGSGAPTILRILDAPMGTPVPVTLTNWDFGFLRGLYSVDPDLRSGAQRSAIASSVTKRIEGAASAPEPAPEPN